MIDEQQIDAIYEQLYKPIFHYTLRQCSDADLAERIVIDVLESLWQRQELPNKLHSFLCTSARWKLMNRYRDDQHLAPIEDAINQSFDHDLRPVEEEVENQFAQEEQDGIIQQVFLLIVSELTPRQHHALLLRTIEDHSTIETAQAMSISECAAHSLFRKAVLKIRNKLGVHVAKNSTCSYGAFTKERIPREGYCNKHLRVAKSQDHRRSEQRKNGWS